MNKQIKKLHSRIVKGITPQRDIEKLMRNINKDLCSEQDFETIAQAKGITIRELVTNWNEHIPEQNNY